MADIGAVGSRVPVPVPAENQQIANVDRGPTSPSPWPIPDHLAGLTQPLEPSGGQLPPAGVPGSRSAPGSDAQGGRVLPDVSSGLDPSQLVAAEQMRMLGGATATAQLLGLNMQPTFMGAFLPPPGNTQALRY